ncbi:unnamed protein product, partial [Amoebophrya sp. A25]
ENVDLKQCRNVNELSAEHAAAGDIMKLPFSNDAAVLDCLRNRYQGRDIYSFVKPMVVILNPYQDLKNTGAEFIRKYRFLSSPTAPDPEVPPHVFSLCRTAWQAQREQACNISFVISGESGAGKTETTKHIMKYFATETTFETVVQDAIMRANPLLEAFGNAKTERNDNSSRFGRFVELYIGQEQGGIRAGFVQCYLLEKSRVVSASSSERCYHIFYQLLAGLSPEDKALCQVLDGPEQYDTLRKTAIKVANVDDRATFQEEVVPAFYAIGFEEEELPLLWRIISAVMRSGNVRFEDGKDDGETPPICKNEADLDAICALLGIDRVVQPTIVIVYSKNVAASQLLQSKYCCRQVVHMMLSVARSVFEQLFIFLYAFIVKKLNEKIKPDAATVESQQWVGLLDIFGFEYFEENSLEQFFINFANERLQQFFLQVVFESEMALLKGTGLDVRDMTYSDNQDVLTLIDNGKPPGILQFLEEQCLLSKGTDEGFTNRVNKTFGDHARLIKPKFESKERECFLIVHGSAVVTYSTKGFRSKNMDRLDGSLVALLKSSENKLVVKVFDDVQGGGEASSKMKGSLIGSQFSRSMEDLMNKLKQARGHFVRCIKPNIVENPSNPRLKKPGLFEAKMVLQQLQSLSILEAVELRRKGYAYRTTFRDFVSEKEYFPLLLLSSS